MANILLSTRCNRACPYCFARDEMGNTRSATLMSWENLIYLADLHEASGQRNISLLGGEPTLHPQFVDFAVYLLHRDFNVTVFTNGILNSTRLRQCDRYLTKFDPNQLSFVCNMNDPNQTPAPADHGKKIENFLNIMGAWTLPGFNIYRLDFELDFLFDSINKFGMKRHMRLGITHPVPGSADGFIRPDSMRKAIARLYEYRPLFDSLRVSPGIDCGFPLCQFTDEELGWLHHYARPVQFRCSPGLDITPDMTVYYCFPLSRYKRRSVFEFVSLTEMQLFYQEIQNDLRREISGIFEICDGCRHKEAGVCGGGGLCQLMNRFVQESPVRGIMR